MQVRELRLRNFKIFQNAKVPFSRLTLLTGANSSGKSTVLNALASIAQTTSPYIFPFNLVVNGENCVLGAFRDILRHPSKEKAYGIGVTFDTSIGVTNIDADFRHSSSGNQTLIERIRFGLDEDKLDVIWKGQSEGYHARIEPDTAMKLASSESMLKILSDLVRARMAVSLDKGTEDIENNLKKQMEKVRGVEPQTKWLTSRTADDIRAELDAEPGADTVLGFIARSVNELQRDLAYVGPVRAHPLRFYVHTSKTKRVHVSGANAVEILQEWQKCAPAKYNEVISILRTLELADDIIEDSRTEDIIRLRVKPFRHRERVNLVDVGFGVAQILPVIVADVALPKGGTLLVNQPEVHLHPSSQACLANYMVERLDKRNYIIETHSEYIINRLRLLMAQKPDLKEDDVSVLYFGVPAGSAKPPRIYNVRVTKDGALKGAPKKFFETYFVDTFSLATAIPEKG